MKMQHIDALETLRQRFEAQIESLRGSLEGAQKDLISKGTHFDQQVAGKLYYFF